MEGILEVCVDNIESARIAEMGGADRIELCQALESGGLTPSFGLMRVVKEVLDIPVFTMIRARSGDFSYSALEITQMKEDIQSALDVGINGFVFGVLKDGAVDKEGCCSLLSECKNLPATFHRAFDLVQNPFGSLSDIIEIGFSRILTSGQSSNAYKGKEIIKSLIEKADSKIIIMPGCGINLTNLQEIKEFTLAKEYHSSAQLTNTILEDSNVVKGTTYHYKTSYQVVQQMKNILCNKM